MIDKEKIKSFLEKKKRIIQNVSINFPVGERTEGILESVDEILSEIEAGSFDK